MILGVDPDTKALAWAEVTDAGLLVDCGLIRATGMEDMLGRVRRLGELLVPPVLKVVVERPQLYGTHDRANPNKIGELLTIGGCVVGHVPGATVRLPHPAQWKGQTPKAIHHARLVKRLGASSVEHLNRRLKRVPSSLRHNVLDAVGLALWGIDEKAL